jgi:phage terminase large subunit
LSTLSVDVPRALAPLLGDSRYKAAYGGRGGAKSHFFGEQLVLRCYRRPTRAVCIREVQTSLKESVRQLIIDKIKKLGMGSFFRVLKDEIRGRNGSLIIFRGMQTYNAENIKSLEDFDLAWVEEAQTFSDHSLRLLRPTIRKDGSEIWFSWNPRHDTDAVDKFFRGKAPPGNAIICPVNWYDNPWFPAVLVEEKDQDYQNDPEVAEHVWGGGYDIVTEAAYFSRQVAAAEKEGRVGFYPYDHALPVYTGWDLGVDDYTAIWFFQVRETEAGPRVRIVDYYEASGIGADEILAEALPEYTVDLQDRAAAMVELSRSRSFRYARHFLPHDVGNREWGAGARTRIETLVSLGVPLHLINRGVAQDPTERINASRRLLPMCEFHQSARVMKGLSRLRRYCRKKNTALQTFLGPLHDENSHGADAFGEFAINCGVEPPRAKPPPKLQSPPPGKWMIPPPEPPSARRIRF